MKLQLLYEAFQESDKEQNARHTAIYNQIISQIHVMARTHEYNENTAKDLLLNFMRMVGTIPYGHDTMSKVQEDEARARVLEAAQTAYASSTQDNLLKFAHIMSKFWMAMIY